MEPRDITVVIPAYRAERTIARALDSVLAQGCGQVIVVVDGDVDRTGAIASAYADPRVDVVVEKHNAGAQQARNRGLARTATPLVMFVDADDYVEGPLLAGLADAIDCAAGDVAFGPMEIEDEASGHRRPRILPDYASAPDLFWKWFVERQVVAPCAVLWRASSLRAVGGWDETLRKNQDGELVVRAALRGLAITVSDRGAGIYVQHDAERISRSAATLESLFAVPEKVLATSTDVIDEATKRAACARHDYRIAWDCFRAGHDTLGRTALRRSRAMGFRGTLGPLPYRVAARIVGLRATVALARWAKRTLRG